MSTTIRGSIIIPSADGGIGLSLGDDDLVVCMDADTVIHPELLENAEYAGIRTVIRALIGSRFHDLPGRRVIFIYRNNPSPGWPAGFRPGAEWLRIRLRLKQAGRANARKTQWRDYTQILGAPISYALIG